MTIVKGITGGLTKSIVNGVVFDSSTVDTSEKITALVGDSITLQNSSSNRLNSLGYVTQHNYRTNNRFPFSHEDNYAAGGGSLGDMASNIATDLANKDYDAVFFMGGANDVPSGNALSQMQTWASTVRDAVSAKGAALFWYTILPRTLDGGAPLSASEKQKLLDFNDWVTAQHNPSAGIYVIDAYDDLADGSGDPDPQYFQDESGKLLHPNVMGAYKISVKSDDILTPFFGSRDQIPTLGDSLLLRDMSGTGGTIEFTNTASGVVADGVNVYGFGNNDPLSRVFSKTGDDRQNADIDIPDVGNSSVNYYMEEINSFSSNFTTGDKLYAWAAVRINSGSFSDGPQLFLRDTNASTNYVGFVKAGGTSGSLPANDIGDGLITTPVFEVSADAGSTDLDLYILGQIDADGQSGSVDFDVVSWGINKL